MASTQRGSWRSEPITSDRPAGAAERTPEGPKVADGQPGAPGGGVIMSVNLAAPRASAGVLECRLGGLAIGPRRVAAESPDGRPVRHRRRRSAAVQGREVACREDDSA